MTRWQALLDVAAHALASSQEASDAPLGPQDLSRKLTACYRALRRLTRTGLAPAGSLQHRDAHPSYHLVNPANAETLVGEQLIWNFGLAGQTASGLRYSASVQNLLDQKALEPAGLEVPFLPKAVP